MLHVRPRAPLSDGEQSSLHVEDAHWSGTLDVGLQDLAPVLLRSLLTGKKHLHCLAINVVYPAIPAGIEPDTFPPDPLFPHRVFGVAGVACDGS
jgi:hypothetical protein